MFSFRSLVEGSRKNLNNLIFAAQIISSLPIFVMGLYAVGLGPVLVCGQKFPVILIMEWIGVTVALDFLILCFSNTLNKFSCDAKYLQVLILGWSPSQILRWNRFTKLIDIPIYMFLSDFLLMLAYFVLTVLGQATWRYSVPQNSHLAAYPRCAENDPGKHLFIVLSNLLMVGPSMLMVFRFMKLIVAAVVVAWY